MEGYIKPQHEIQLTIGRAILLITMACGDSIAQSARIGAPTQNTPATSEASQINTQDKLGGKDNADCPAAVRLLKVSPSKPPMKFYQFTLRLMNRRAGPMWLVFRHGDPLPDSGRFLCDDDKTQCFSSVLFTKREAKEVGAVVEVSFLGKDEFTAIRLPKDGDIRLDSYFFTTAYPVVDFEIWEVDSLMVNGKTPVEQWLPYRVLSDRSVHLRERENMTVLDWDKKLGNYRRDYPDEKVEFVIAHAIKKWLAPLTPATRKR